MRKITLLQLVLVGLVVVALSSCNGLKKMKKNAGTISYTVTPNPLEMHADSVAITVKGKFPAKYFNKKVILVATPVLKSVSGTGETACKPVTVQGEKVQDNFKVISYTSGGDFSYTETLPYNENMRVSDLELRITAKKGKKELAFDPVKIGTGVIATPGLVNVDPKPIIGKDQFQRITPESKEADVLFKIQQANLQQRELKKEEVKALLDYINEVMADERKDLKKVELSAYASPDGPLDLNTKLSNNRGTVTQKFLKKKFRKQEKLASDSIYGVQITDEDWAGFKQLMEKSSLADKDLVLRVLSMYSDPDQREKEIKNMSKVYTEIANEILPKLRRSVIKVDVDKIGYSDDEIKQIYAAKPDSLNVEELLYAATLFTDNSKKLEIYNKFMEIYPNDWRGPNNAGAMKILENDVDAAKTLFEKAKQLKDNNPIVENNLGVVCFMKGNLAEAKTHFVAASGAGSEVNYNLGTLSIKQGDYSGAVTYFGNDCSFNAALAKLLNQDYAGAVKTVDCAPNKDDAMMFYLKAVAGVRNSDNEAMFNNLRAAFEEDAKLKDLAKTDMEFAKFFEDTTFKSLVK